MSVQNRLWSRAPRRRSRTNERKLIGALCASTSFLALAPAVQAADPQTASAVGQVLVTAPRQEIKARNVQLQAPNLISVQSAETIAKYPDFNAAEALSRMPGVSLSSDTGEGRFVNIRGIDGNLDGATFGGVTLLNTFPGGTYFSGGGRAVEFDTVPTGAIDGLIVTYTGLPDHEAEGLGGSVELTPRSAANIKAPFIDGTLGWGDEPAHSHTGPLDVDFAAGVRFGLENGHVAVEGEGAPLPPRIGFVSNPTPFSFVVTGSTQQDRRGFDDIEEDYNNPGTADRSYSDIALRRYDYHRVRFGYGGEFDFTPNEDHNYFLRANVAGYTEAVKKNRLTYDFSNDDGAAGDEPLQIPTGTGFAGTADLSIKSTDEQETHQNQIFVVGGRDHWGEIGLDYRASYSTATYDQNLNYGTTFNGPSVAVTYNNSANNGDFPTINVTDGTNINDPSLYSLKHGVVSAGQEHDRDDEYAYAANLLFPVHLFNDTDRVKVGLEVRLRNKDQNVYVFGDAGDVDIGALNLADASGPAITDFYGHYTNGPDVNTLKIRALAETAQGSLQFDPTQYFQARENIYAGYGQYTATLGKVGLLAGVRIEATAANYGNYVVDTDANVLGFVNNTKNYTNIFPTVQLRYDFTSTLVLRATYSTGIGRPGFNQIAGAVTLDQDNGIVTSGNPNLKPTTGNSFDLDLEYYLPKGGIVQIGAFDKEFSNYVVTEVDHVPSDPRLPDDIDVKLQTFANVSSAYARGIEAAYHQQFVWLPRPFNGLGFEGNVTLVDSRIEEYDAATSDTGHAEYGLLPGTSRVTANFAGFYEAHGVEARLSGEYVGAELFSLGGSKAEDTIEDNRLTLDFASSYAFNKHWKLYFNVKNLTNAPLRFYEGNSSFPIQREFYDATYEGGVKVSF